MAQQPMVAKKGIDATLGAFYHILLPPIEEAGTRIFAMIGNKAVLHEIDAAANIVSTVVDIPLVKEVAGILDLITQAENAAHPLSMPAVQ